MNGQYFPFIDFNGIQGVINQWKKEAPDIVILALIPEAERHMIPRLQEIVTLENIPLAGAVFPAILANDQFHSQGLILLPVLNNPWFGIFSGMKCEYGDTGEKVREISEIVGQNIAGNVETTLLMFFDAMIPDISTILDKLYLNLADRIHYMGANAGSETFKPMPALFDNHDIVQDGLLVMLLKEHPGAILEHGYQAPCEMISATATKSNRIITVDWRPAFEVYSELIKKRTGINITPDNFYENAVHYPFGIIRASGEILVRIPVALENDGSIFCVGEVPANSILTLLDAPQISETQTMETLQRGIAAQTDLLKRHQTGDVLAFYCAGRRMHLGYQASNELLTLRQKTLAGNIFGAICLGEIGSSVQGGYPLFHNATIVCSLWGTS